MRAIPGRFLRSIVWSFGLWWLAGITNAQQLSFVLPEIRGGNVSVAAGEASATAVCFLGTECPMARTYMVQLNELQAEFAEMGVRIVGVMSNRQDSAKKVAAFAAELDALFPILHDEGNAVADRFGANRTPEVFLLDEQLKLRYRGRVDDRLAPGVVRSAATRQDLKIAIQELLAGKPISVLETRALGCIIGRVSPSAGPDRSVAAAESATFCNEVARVLQTHCVECHRAGEVGPFSMESYEDVLGWAETMLETIDNGRMPPWHADPNFGSFANERLMPEQDKQILRTWIKGGCQRGDKALMPPPLSIVQGWNLPRQPDLVVEMRARPFTVPKDGMVEYQYFVVDPGFEEDQWITAAEIVPGARSVVHHAILFVRPPDGSEFSGIGWLTAYVPGQRVHQLPPGRARKVPAGSKFVFQMHYTPNGVEQQDVTRVGLVLIDPPEVTHEVFTLLAINQEFEIPPGAPNYKVQASMKRPPQGGELLAITPHMHFRGKSFKLYAGTNSNNLLLNVPNYDFNWQHTYLLSQPLPLSELGELRFEAAFDNSASNPFNPDPTQAVTWGDQTWEEMAVAFFEVARPLDDSVAFNGIPDSTEGHAVGVHAIAPEKDAAAKLEKKRQEQVEQYVRRVLQGLDANGDGIIKKSEVSIVVRHVNFRLWDLNEDNVVTEAELREVAQRLFPAN